MMNTPAQLVDIAEDGLIKKATSPFRVTFLSAMFAGALIGVGFVFYTTSQVGAADLPFGLAKVIGGIVFSTGLALVIVTGADLFTSTSMTLLPASDGKLAWSRLLQHWGVVYLGNFVGSVLIASIVFMAGTPGNAAGGWGAVVLKVSVAKVSHSWLEVFFLGVMCNFMVCLAVWMSFAGKTVTDKVLAVTFPIALFVASGFEHSVANMFMLPLGLMLKGQADPTIMEALGTGVNLDALNAGTVLVNNLIPVTLGNIVGGGVMIGLGMFLWHRRLNAVKASEEVAR
ncbi:MAG: formate transporter FocA [Bowdeniella nasicola]|nr:formate transporter FocA [Bowdeniella nasicola]